MAFPCHLDMLWTGIDNGSFITKDENQNINYTDLCKLYLDKYDNGEYFAKITPFCVACELGHIRDVERFIELTKEENRTGVRPEHGSTLRFATWVSSYGVTSLFRLPTLQNLVDGISPVHGKGVIGLNSRPFKTRPLLVALENGHKYIFKLLIDEGASIDIDDTRGGNALHYAMFYGTVAMTYGILDYILCIAKERGKLDNIKNQIMEANGSSPLDTARAMDLYNLEGWVSLLQHYGCKANKYDSEGEPVGRGYGELTAKVMVPGYDEYKLGFFRQKKLWPEIEEKYRAVDAAGYQIENDNYVQCIPCNHIFAASFLHGWVMYVDETGTKKRTCPKCVQDIYKIRWLNKEESIENENIISRGYDSNSNREEARRVPAWTNRRVEKDKLVLKF